MTDETTRDRHPGAAALHRALAAQEARLATLEATVRRRRRAWPRIPLLLAALLLLLAPLAALADDRFGDVPTGNPHHDDIALIAAAGITKGCNPPGNTQYCPEDYVTRQQMASFLARTAGLGPNPPVANAKTAQNAGSAQTAANAAALDGRAASGFVRAARTIVPNDYFANPPQQPIEVTTAFPSFQAVGTVAIAAPSTGFVLVTAQSVSASSNNVVIYLRLRDATSGELSPLVVQGVGVGVVKNNGPYDVIVGSDLNAALTPSHLFPVAAGTRTFVLEAATSDSANSTKHGLANTTITALFVPFGYDGGSGLAP